MVKITKLVFLDIDGVMKSVSSTVRAGGDRYANFLHPEHAEALKFILEHTDARIVISSSYREFMSVKELGSLFEKSGIPRKYVISKTASLNKGWNGDVERGDEVNDWLRLAPADAFNYHGVDIDVESFVVLDDDNDFSNINPLNFIRTNGNYGLTHYEALEAIEILNGEPLLPSKVRVVRK
jgi:hypothetical protein